MYGWFLSLFNLLLSKNFFLNYFEILLPWLLSTGYLSDIIMVTSSWWYHSWWPWSQYLEFYGPILIKNSWKLSKYWPKLANVYKQSSNFSSNYQKFQLIFPKYLQTKCQITHVTWVIFTLWIKILANFVHSWKHLPHIKGSQFGQFLSPDPRQRQTTTPNFSNYGNWIHIIIHICNMYDCLFV